MVELPNTARKYHLNVNAFKISYYAGVKKDVLAGGKKISNDFEGEEGQNSFDARKTFCSFFLNWEFRASITITSRVHITGTLSYATPKKENQRGVNMVKGAQGTSVVCVCALLSNLKWHIMIFDPI